ncbi:hypothetical protein M406DRAFT_321416 [Cryphonectria parasitica EP155]|uniref:Uncharacterized protein n=1 Tax=Cryphonectria parasitica (strain ATCC 38755 / EP155) TaxID=660469 RepID=A0A9P4Y5N5_CRYP1|nr:uncharacterized protein M406DRAFT_321416 [Cryphonectria parasitica EP155]KAF3766946.1 hypothetical protein M406DRAFT_321416 [Cryphonectria parasitica EP155]
MTTDTHQLELALGLMYACGILLELLIRMFQGVPQCIPEAFYQRPCLIALRPVVFFFLPALLWPFIMTYRILRPIINVYRECCLHQEDYFDHAETASSASTGSDDMGPDLEKQVMKASEQQQQNTAQQPKGTPEQKQAPSASGSNVASPSETNAPASPARKLDSNV